MICTARGCRDTGDRESDPRWHSALLSAVASSRLRRRWQIGSGQCRGCCSVSAGGGVACFASAGPARVTAATPLSGSSRHATPALRQAPRSCRPQQRAGSSKLLHVACCRCGGGSSQQQPAAARTANPASPAVASSQHSQPSQPSQLQSDCDCVAHTADCALARKQWRERHPVRYPPAPPHLEAAAPHPTCWVGSPTYGHQLLISYWSDGLETWKLGRLEVGHLEQRSSTFLFVQSRIPLFIKESEWCCLPHRIVRAPYVLKYDYLFGSKH